MIVNKLVIPVHDTQADELYQMIHIIGYGADVIQNGQQHIGQHHYWTSVEIRIYANSENPWTLLDRAS